MLTIGGVDDGKGGGNDDPDEDVKVDSQVLSRDLVSL